MTSKVRNLHPALDAFYTLRTLALLGAAWTVMMFRQDWYAGMGVTEQQDAQGIALVLMFGLAFFIVLMVSKPFEMVLKKHFKNVEAAHVETGPAA